MARKLKKAKNVHPLSRVNRIDFSFESDEIFGISPKRCGKQAPKKFLERGHATDRAAQVARGELSFDLAIPDWVE